MGLMSPSAEDDSGSGSLAIPRLGDSPITRLWSTIFRVSIVACSNGDWWSMAEKMGPGLVACGHVQWFVVALV